MTTHQPSILQEALDLTTGDRQEAYGHPYYNFHQTAIMLNATFVGRGSTTFTAEDIPIIMIIVKVAREIHKHKRDNLVDIAGYANTLDMVYQKGEERG